MAQVAGLLDQDQLNCSICLDILKNPVGLPCGHSYCLGCIEGCWNQDDHTGVYKCPQCREIFNPRPFLRKNKILNEMVEKLQKTGLHASASAPSYTGPGDVTCDVCFEEESKAVMSCLVCLASYCETHLQPHYASPPLKKHRLVKATGNLPEMMCTHHDKVLEVYCRTDQQIICYLCTIEDHRGHDTVSVATVRSEKQKQVSATQSEFQQRIQEREKELQDLRQAVQSLKLSAQAAVEDNERMFTELIQFIERRRSAVEELIRDQEMAEVSRAEGFLEQLEQEIAELRWRDAELEQLSHTEDHIHFLKSSQSLCAFPGPGDLSSFPINPHISFEGVRKCVSGMKEQLEDVCQREMSKISETCLLCMKPMQKKQRLICNHAFCTACLHKSIKQVGLKCPQCPKVLRLLGDQPQGQMTVKNQIDFNGLHTCIEYYIPKGIQREGNPNPGKPFTGIRTKAWLPFGREGHEVLKLLQRAFDQRLIFTVAATDEAADRVIFSDIPHAQFRFQCNQPGFLRTVRLALRAKFIR